MIYKELVNEMEKRELFDRVNPGIEYRKKIITLFDRYFENKENLEKYSNDYLVQDYINYQRSKFGGIDICLEELIELLHDAKKISLEMTCEGMARFQITMAEMGNKYWSMCKMQNDFEELEPYEYVAECFTLIENVSEILLKNYFALYIYCIRLIKSRNSDLEQVKKMKFGNMCNEVNQSGKLIKTLGILNSTISLSQWRNIACHKSYQYTGGKIVCKYGNELQNTVIINSKEELLRIVLEIYRISQVFTMASKFFLYDNILEIRKKMDELNIDLSEFREEDWQLIYVTELYANGFSVTDISDDEKIIITIRDHEEYNLKERVVLLPIAAYKAWVLTDKSVIKIIYELQDGTPYAGIELTAEDCEAFSSEEKEVSYLAEKMKIEIY